MLICVLLGNVTTAEVGAPLQKIWPTVNETLQVQFATFAVPMLGFELVKLEKNSSTKCWPLNAPRSLVLPTGSGEHVLQHVGCEMLVHVAALLLNPAVQVLPQLNVSQNRLLVENPAGQLAPHLLKLPQLGAVVHVEALLLNPDVQVFPQLNMSQNRRVGKLPPGQLPQVVNVEADVISPTGSSRSLVGVVLQPLEAATSTLLTMTASRKTYLKFDIGPSRCAR